MIHNKIIAIDYDGTCTERNEFPHFGKLRDGLKECINHLRNNNNVVILWTCRHDEILDETVNFLESNEIHFDYINENPPYRIEEYNDCRKVGADFYIDDKNIFCKEINWYDIYRYFDCMEE